MVLFPVLRKWDDRAAAAELMHRVGIKFRAISWSVLVILIGTGISQAQHWGLFTPAMMQTDLGRRFMWKLTLVALVLVISLYHDFILGPKVMQGLRDAAVAGREPEGALAGQRRLIGLIGRLNGLLGVAIIALAVMIALP